MNTSIIILTYNRKKELEENLTLLSRQNGIYEIIIVDNNSTDNTESVVRELKSLHPIIKFYKLNSNRGVSGGRNFGVEKAKGDILFFIDDDALLWPEDAIERIHGKFLEEPDLGILAFKVLNFYSGEIQKNAFPHRLKSLNPDREFETSYFNGTGHAIRREVFEKCGLYPEEYFYGMEELDLSFRALDKGYKIIYFPEVVIYHKKSPLGRVSDSRKWVYLFRNRLAVSYKYLNYWHLIVLSFIWFFKILFKSRSITVPIQGIKSFLDMKKELKREPLKEITFKRVKKLEGRLWY